MKDINNTVVPEQCSDATHAELVMSGSGDPFLVLMPEEGVDCTVVRMGPLLDFAAAHPQLRRLMEKSLAVT
jgi:hypothetical protein